MEVVHTKKQHKHKKIPKLISSIALFKAAENKNIAGVKYLLEHGISPNITYTYGPFIDQTILNWAVLSAYYPIVILLLEKGANPNNKNSLLQTSLHLAVDYTNTKIIKALLKSGALVNVQDALGFNSLHIAIKSKFNCEFNVIKLLLQYGASLTIKTTHGPYKGKTPIKLLEETSYLRKEKDTIALKALLEFEQLYLSKKLPRIVKKDYISKSQIEDFIKWKAEAEIPKFIKSNISLLNKNIQRLFALSKFLQNNLSLVSSEVGKLFEEKIQEYVGKQNLRETKQPILTLKHFATLKIVQNPEECSKHFSDILPLPVIEMIEKLEKEYGVNLSGVVEKG